MYIYLIKSEPFYLSNENVINSIVNVWNSILKNVLTKTRKLVITFRKDFVVKKFNNHEFPIYITNIFIESPIVIDNEINVLKDVGMEIFRTLSNPLPENVKELKEYFIDDKGFTYITYYVHDLANKLNFAISPRLLTIPEVYMVRIYLELGKFTFSKLEQLAIQLSSSSEVSRDRQSLINVIADLTEGDIPILFNILIVLRSRNKIELFMKLPELEAKFRTFGLDVKQVIGHPYCILKMQEFVDKYLTSSRNVAFISTPCSNEIIEENGFYAFELIHDVSQRIGSPIILNPYATHSLIKHGLKSYRAVQHILIFGMSGGGKSGIGAIWTFRMNKQMNVKSFIIDVKGFDYRYLSQYLDIPRFDVDEVNLDPLILWNPNKLNLDVRACSLAAAITICQLVDVSDISIIHKLANEIYNIYKLLGPKTSTKLLLENLQDNELSDIVDEFHRTFEDYLIGNLPDLKHGIIIDLGNIPDVEDPKSITNPKTAILLLTLPLIFHFSNNVKENEKGLVVFDEAWRLLKVNQAKTVLELAFRTL